MLLFAAILGFSAVAEAAKDVPKGECHSCEVLCFEDCAARYDSEIIQAERRDAALKQKMIDTHGSSHASARGIVLAQDAPTADQKSPEMGKAVGDFVTCLKADKCPNHPAPGAGCQLGETQANSTKANKTSLLAETHCVSGDQPCTQGCAAKALGAPDAKAPAFVQKNLRRSSLYPRAPVTRGAFSSGKMTLDFCMKSCLAVTCGCSSAPGFEKISKLFKQIKVNHDAGDPVADTKATWQFKAATQQECANGIPGKKINKDLYVNFGQGWSEICTQDYFDAFFGPAYPGTKEALKRCKSRALEDQKFGCSWNGMDCVMTANVPAFPCFKRFKRDPTL